MPAESVVINTFLTGWREFVAGAEAEATSLRELGVAAGFTAGSFEKTTARTWAMNQAMFTARRVVYGGTLVLLGAGAAALRLGWSYQTAMQQASVAMRPVFRDNAQLKSELGLLFRIAAYTPFQFKDITVAFRQMYLAMHPLGISASTVNTTIHSLADALSATGRTSPGALNRVAVALQHMAYMGHLTGQVVLQLARDGLPIYAALHKELGLNAEQLHNIGAEGVTSAEALRALNSYIETTPGFMNAAFRQATGTLFGAWTTFKDLLSQAVGSSNAGFFGTIQRTLQRIDAALAPFTKADKPLTLTNFISAVDQVLSPRTHAVLSFFELLRGTLQGLNLTMRAVSFTIQMALYPLGLFGGGTHQAALGTRYFGIVLGTYLGLLLLWRTYLIAMAVAEHIWEAAMTAGYIGMLIYSSAYRLGEAALSAFAVVKALITGEEIVDTAAVVANTAAQGAATAVTWERDAATGALVATTLAATVATEGATVAAAGFSAVLLANPIGLIVAAIVLLIGGLVLLYFKWQAFHNLVDSTFHWMESHWPLLLGIIGGPFALAVVLIIRYFRQIENAALGTVHRIGHAFGWLGSETSRLWNHIPGHGMLGGLARHIPFLADGGHVTSAGSVIVGERGRELLTLPTGATVTPLSVPIERGTMSSLQLNQRVFVLLDGKELTKSVATIVTDKEARQ